MKFKIPEVITTFSCFGILSWIAADFFGGMGSFLIFFWYIILPVCLLYLVSLVVSVIIILRFGIRNNQLIFYMHFVVLIIIILFGLSSSEIFKSKVVLSATLHDDLFHYQLKLRENGNCDIECVGMLGSDQTFYGKYTLKNDTITFQKVPYDNPNFIPEKILIDKKQQAIFIKKKENGEFDREKNFVNYFKFDQP